MSKFNSTVATPKTLTKNLAGGQAYQQSAELELVSLLLTSMVTDQAYRKEDDVTKRLIELLAKCDPKFAAQAAIYARNEFGMRSISHIAASELGKHIGGQEWATSFYNKIVFRVDDMTEIASYHKSKNGKYPNAMKRGFAKAFDRFDEYQLAKYKGDDKTVKLVDLVNVCHPVPVEKNAEALKKLVEGTLKNTGTWEAKLSQAGQADTTEEVAAQKTQSWVDLIRGKKLGYLALLRNLENIMNQAPEVLEEALLALTNINFIKSSKVFPFQFLVAYKQFLNVNTKVGRLIADSLNKAVELSCINVKELGFTGETLVVVDNSGSMTNPVATSKHMRCSELGAVFGMILAKAVNADIMEFGSTARYIPYNLRDNVLDFGANFHHLNKVGHGTDFHSIFRTANKAYDRIVIFSDMQGWAGGYSPANTSLKEYNKRLKADPRVYSFDLAGNGTMQFPERNVYSIAGFSDKTFNVMKTLEQDRNALINTIKKVEI